MMTEIENPSLDMENHENDNMKLVIHNNKSRLMHHADDDLFNDDSTLLDNESRLNVVSVTTQNSAESNDSFLNLPSDWMNYDFKRKKSCILSNTYFGCVTKAINHLEALQNSIDIWMSTIERALPESASSSESAKRLINYIRTTPSTSSSHVKHELKFVNKLTSESRSDQLEVNGIGGQLISNKTDLVVIENKSPVEDLSVGGILDEILVLIIRLECQRKRAEYLLKQERETIDRLKTKIERVALKRAIELPLKVQNEHEACISDITELNWHISFNSKALRKLMRKVELEERMHEQLEEEIGNIKKNSPLIDEKIKIESEIIQKILHAQQDVDDLLAKATEKLNATKERSEIAHNKANKEREAIQAELNNSRWELNKSRKRLQDAEDVFRNTVKTLEDCHAKIKQNDIDEKQEITKKLNLKDLNETLKEKHQNIEIERYRIDKERERVRKENETKSNEIEALSQKYNDELDKLTQALNKRLEKLEKILSKKQEKEIDIEEMNKDRKNVELKLEKDEKTKERLLDEKFRIEEELRRAYADRNSAINQNKNIVFEHDKELKRINSKEDILRKQIFDLQKLIGEERNLINGIIARMSGEISDYELNKKTYEEKKQQFDAKKIEQDATLNKLENKVKDVETKKLALDNDVAKLQKELNEWKDKYPKFEKTTNSQIQSHESTLDQILEKYNKNKTRLEFIKSHTIKMNTEIVQTNEQKNMIKKSIEKNLLDIKSLEALKAELTVQYLSSKKLDEENQQSVTDVTNRIEQTAIDHSELIEDRKRYLERLNVDLEKYLSLNRELASRYRFLKYDMFNVRFNVMRKIEIKLTQLLSVKDKRQMQSLQERMHSALKDFFYYKLKQSEIDFDKLDFDRDKETFKIESIEGNLNECIHDVEQFLDNQIDYSRLTQIVAQKVHKEELIEQQKREKKQQKNSKLVNTDRTANNKNLIISAK